MIPAIVLAAGASSRMGRPKALLPIGGSGECFVTRIVRTFAQAGVEHTLVIVRPGDETVCEALERAGIAADVVANPTPERGQLSSLQVALASLDRPGVAAALVTLVDVPLVRSDTIALLLSTYRRTGSAIVRPTHAGRRGHPYVLARALFSEMRTARLAGGARAVLGRHAAQTAEVAVDDAGVLIDIDTPADLARISGDVSRLG